MKASFVPASLLCILLLLSPNQTHGFGGSRCRLLSKNIGASTCHKQKTLVMKGDDLGKKVAAAIMVTATSMLSVQPAQAASTSDASKLYFQAEEAIKVRRKGETEAWSNWKGCRHRVDEHHDKEQAEEAEKSGGGG